MTSAREIALSAAAIARKAAELEAIHEEALKENERRRKETRHREDYEAALPILAEWFPGVEWDYHAMGDWGNDTILWDRSESWPPSFMLRVSRRLIDMNEGPSGGYKTYIEVGQYRPDTSQPGYNYFAGSKVKSAADVGHYLERASS